MATDAIYETPAPPASGLTLIGAGISSGQSFSPYGQGTPAASAPTPLTSALSTAPPAAPRKSRSDLIIGILIALVVLLASALGVSLYALAHKQHAANTPIPTATPNETILYQNTFTLNATEWAHTSHCFFQNGAYHIRGNYVCFAPAGVVPNGNISVDAQQVAGPLNWFYGMVFRITSQGNFYQFGIDSSGSWYFGKVVNEVVTAIVQFTRNPAIKEGLNTVNTLFVRMKGSHFDFYINGTKVGEADDTTFSAGICGIQGGGGGIEVAYNNFKITFSS